MDGVTFTGDASIMTKLMSISSWVLERSSEEDLQLQTKETAEGFRVATRGLLTMPERDGAETCRAIYCMEFEMQAIFVLYLGCCCCLTFYGFVTVYYSTLRFPNALLLPLKRCSSPLLLMCPTTMLLPHFVSCCLFTSITRRFCGMKCNFLNTFGRSTCGAHKIFCKYAREYPDSQGHIPFLHSITLCPWKCPRLFVDKLCCILSPALLAAI
jgi:hypothetical protein